MTDKRAMTIAGAIAALECSLPEEDAMRYAQAAISAEDVKRLVEAARNVVKHVEARDYGAEQYIYDLREELKKWSGE